MFGRDAVLFGFEGRFLGFDLPLFRVDPFLFGPAFGFLLFPPFAVDPVPFPLFGLGLGPGFGLLPFKFNLLS